MSLLEDGLKGMGSSVLVGIGAVVAAPIIIPAVMGGVRPLAKTAIKGYLYLSDSLRETMAEADEQIADLVAEVRAEAANGGTTTEPTRTTPRLEPGLKPAKRGAKSRERRRLRHCARTAGPGQASHSSPQAGTGAWPAARARIATGGRH